MVPKVGLIVAKRSAEITDICQSPVKLGTFRIKQSMKFSSYLKQIDSQVEDVVSKNFQNLFQASWVDLDGKLQSTETCLIVFPRF